MPQGPTIFTHRRGFTLVELVVTLGLVATLATGVAASLSAANATRALAWSNQVDAALREARSASFARRRVVCVQLSSTSISLRIATTPTDTSCAGTLSPTRVAPSGASATLPPGLTYFVFLPSGKICTNVTCATPVSGTITFGSSRAIVVDGSVGVLR